MEKQKYDYNKIERIVKGFANHRRLQILDLLRREPGLSIEAISDRLGMGYMNASDHLRKLVLAGLLSKRNEGALVFYSVTPRATSILGFCKNLK